MIASAAMSLSSVSVIGNALRLRDHLTHADIAVACGLRFLREAHEELYRTASCPALEEHGARSEALAAFQSIYQPIVNQI
jgi:glutathione S-transferase